MDTQCFVEATLIAQGSPPLSESGDTPEAVSLAFELLLLLRQRWDVSAGLKCGVVSRQEGVRKVRRIRVISGRQYQLSHPFTEESGGAASW